MCLMRTPGHGKAVQNGTSTEDVEIGRRVRAATSFQASGLEPDSNFGSLI
jgi:hypothetical protein